MKIIIIIALTLIQCILNYVTLTDAFESYSLINIQYLIHNRIDYVVILITVMIGLIIINRQVKLIRIKFRFNDIYLFFLV